MTWQDTEVGHRAAHLYCASIAAFYPIRIPDPRHSREAWSYGTAVAGTPLAGSSDIMVWCGPEAPFPVPAPNPGPSLLFSEVSPDFARMVVADRVYRDYLRDQIKQTHLPPVEAIEFERVSMGETPADWALVVWRVWYRDLQ